MGAYAEYKPEPVIRPWVRLLWTYSDDNPSGVIQRIPPDGCPELVVHLGAPYEEDQDGRWVAQPRVIFAGQMTRPLALRAAGPVRCVGLRFEPDGASRWFGESMEEATDRRVDVSDRLRAPQGIDEETCRDLMEDNVIQSLMIGQWPLDREVRVEVQRLAGGEEVETSATEQRRMQRLFEKHVGVAPRMLASIFRFRKVFDHAAGAGASWIDGALAAGYFDQPQMARDFRRFLGCTATEWAREQAELARSVALPRRE